MKTILGLILLYIVGTVGLCVILTGCGAQLREAHMLHLKADRNSAITTKEATEKARACAGEPECVSACLRIVDAQADAVLATPVMP